MRWNRRRSRSVCLVVACGLVGTASVAWRVAYPPPVFEAATEIVLVGPSESTANPYVESGQSLVHLAGLLATSVARSAGGTFLVDSDVPLASQGVHRGFQVRQPDQGGQWGHDFQAPIVTLQTVAPTEQEARAALAQLLDRLTGELKRRESEAGTSSGNIVRTATVPQDPVISVMAGSRSRATAVTVLLGLWLSFSMGAAVERIGRRRR
jgi:hypothetical protein